MIQIIALDLEGTLISNAMSQIPRPGLYDFLTGCNELCERIVMFTTVKEPLYRQIANLLVQESSTPDWFAELEYVNWTGPTKDLAFIPNCQLTTTVLVDDCHLYIHPGQQQNWIEIPQFNSPYLDSDRELEKVLAVLQRKSKEVLI